MLEETVAGCLTAGYVMIGAYTTRWVWKTTDDGYDGYNCYIDYKYRAEYQPIYRIVNIITSLVSGCIWPLYWPLRLLTR